MRRSQSKDIYSQSSKEVRIQEVSTYILVGLLRRGGGGYVEVRSCDKVM
jgi:hypothetical protein